MTIITIERTIDGANPQIAPNPNNTAISKGKLAHSGRRILRKIALTVAASITTCSPDTASKCAVPLAAKSACMPSFITSL